jgi:hypothetical protein
LVAATNDRNGRRLGALAFYNSVKAAARHGEEGAERIVDDLSYHFKRKKKKKDEETLPADSDAAAVAAENPQQNA